MERLSAEGTVRGTPRPVMVTAVCVVAVFAVAVSSLSSAATQSLLPEHVGPSHMSSLRVPERRPSPVRRFRPGRLWTARRWRCAVPHRRPRAKRAGRRYSDGPVTGHGRRRLRLHARLHRRLRSDGRARGRFQRSRRCGRPERVQRAVRIADGVHWRSVPTVMFRLPPGQPDWREQPAYYELELGP